MATETGDGERLARLEAHLEHMATKAWVLGGVVGGMVAAATARFLTPLNHRLWR